MKPRNWPTEHGVAFIDYLIGPHTGRAMAPLATIDLVGWDVHKAIVDNVHANCEDEAHESFAMPAYMNAALRKGCLGDKTPERGGFYRRAGKASLRAESENRRAREVREAARRSSSSKR